MSSASGRRYALLAIVLPSLVLGAIRPAFAAHSTGAAVTRRAPARPNSTLGAPRIAVYVGYYDTHHPGSPQPKPNPWMGSPHVQFSGNPDSSIGGWDTSAIRIDNCTGFTIPNVHVTVEIGDRFYALWAPVTIDSARTLILAQTAYENFDGSDANQAGCINCDPNDCVTLKSDAIPVVHVTYAGTQLDLEDQHQVLNTHGADAAGCPFDGNRNDESEAWRRIYPDSTFTAAAPLAENRPSAGELELAPPSPDPSWGDLAIRFRLAMAGPVRVEIADVLGRRVRLVLDEVLAEGEHLRRLSLAAMPAGIYWCTLHAGGDLRRRSFALVR